MSLLTTLRWGVAYKCSRPEFHSAEGGRGVPETCTLVVVGSQSVFGGGLPGMQSTHEDGTYHADRGGRGGYPGDRDAYGDVYPARLRSG